MGHGRAATHRTSWPSAPAGLPSVPKVWTPVRRARYACVHEAWILRAYPSPRRPCRQRGRSARPSPLHPHRRNGHLAPAYTSSHEAHFLPHFSPGAWRRTGRHTGWVASGTCPGPVLRPECPWAGPACRLLQAGRLHGDAPLSERPLPRHDVGDRGPHEPGRAGPRRAQGHGADQLQQHRRRAPALGGQRPDPLPGHPAQRTHRPGLPAVGRTLRRVARGQGPAPAGPDSAPARARRDRRILRHGPRGQHSRHHRGDDRVGRRQQRRLLRPLPHQPRERALPHPDRRPTERPDRAMDPGRQARAPGGGGRRAGSQHRADRLLPGWRRCTLAGDRPLRRDQAPCLRSPCVRSRRQAPVRGEQRRPQEHGHLQVRPRSAKGRRDGGPAPPVRPRCGAQR